SIRGGDEARLAVEVALLKAARPDLDPGTEGFVRRLERLEREAPAPGAVAPPVAPGPSPASSSPPPVSSVQPAPEPATPDPVEVPALTPEIAPGAEAKPPEPSRPQPPMEATPPSTGAEPPEAAVTAPTEAPASIDGVHLDRLGQLWPAVLDALRGLASGPAASYFEGTRPLRLEESRLTVGFPAGSQFNRRNAEKPERRSQLVAALKSVTGEEFVLDYTELGSMGEEGAEPANEPAVDEEQFVDRVKSEFNAEEVI
ncbi:MAG: hypothetical protein WEB05_01080, partial [Solirubrobacterales bacterium]